MKRHIYCVYLGNYDELLSDPEIFVQSIGLNDASAKYNLGIMFEIGRGVPKDYKKAGELFELAAKNNDIDAHYSLGLLYLHGLGTEKNQAVAFEKFSLAAKAGHAEAQKIIAHSQQQAASSSNSPSIARCSVSIRTGLKLGSHCSSTCREFMLLSLQ